MEHLLQAYAESSDGDQENSTADEGDQNRHQLASSKTSGLGELPADVISMFQDSGECMPSKICVGTGATNSTALAHPAYCPLKDALHASSVFTSMVQQFYGTATQYRARRCQRIVQQNNLPPPSELHPTLLQTIYGAAHDSTACTAL